MGTSKFRFLAMAAAVSIALSACSSTDSIEEPIISLSGIVADGYLENATVCLDLNLNKACDSDEPQAITDVDGKYSFTAGEANAKGFPVISIITALTKDADFPSRVLKPYILSAPAGRPEFISPMTTMIQTEIESNPGMSVDSAENSVKTNLGYGAGSEVSLFKDYVAAKDDTTGETAANRAEYQRIHQVAQVTARTLEDNQGLIETAAANAGVDKDEFQNELMRIIVKKIIEDLSNITNAVDSGDSVDGNGDFSPDIATSNAGVTVNTDNLADDIAAEETVSKLAAMNVTAVLTAGIHDLKNDFVTNVTDSTFSYRTIKLDASGNLSFTSNTWDGSDWALDTDDSVGTSATDYAQLLTANGLLRYDTNATVETFTDNGDGTANLVTKDADANILYQQVLRGAEISLAGKPIRSTFDNSIDQDHQAWMKATPSNAIFAANTKGYRWNFTSASDSYYVWYDESTCESNGVTNPSTTLNCTSLRDATGAVEATALSDLTNNTEFYISGGQSVTLSLTADAGTNAGTSAETGTAIYSFMDGDVTKTISSTYATEKPLGGSVDAIVFSMPRDIRDKLQIGSGSKLFIIIDGGYARMGSVESGGVTEKDETTYYNTASLTSVKNCFMGGSAAGTCQVNFFLRDGQLPRVNNEVAESTETGTMVPYILLTDTTLLVSTNDTEARWTFALGAADATADSNGWRTGTVTPTELNDAGELVAQTTDGTTVKVQDMRWKVTGNGRLKIERTYTLDADTETRTAGTYYDVWMTTQLDDGTTHLRFKSFNKTLKGKQEKNLGSYITLLTAP